MSNVESPEVEMYEGVVEVSYSSDGVLAVPEGTNYSVDEEFGITDTDQIMVFEEGDTVYLEPEGDFAAYDVAEFAAALGQIYGEGSEIGDSSDTKIWDPNKTKVWTDDGSGADTKIFDTTGFEIGDPVEYIKMMKENADTIILELADKDFSGKGIRNVMDGLFDNMDDSYDRFVHENSSSKDKGQYGKEIASQKGKKVTEEDAKDLLDRIEQELEDQSLEKVDKNKVEAVQQSENTVDDYLDVEEAILGDQSELTDFQEEDSGLDDGQAQMSDF